MDPADEPGLLDLLGALAELPPRMREVWTDHELVGLPFSAIGASLGSPARARNRSTGPPASVCGPSSRRRPITRAASPEGQRTAPASPRLHIRKRPGGPEAVALPAELRIAWLLRTYDDACTSWHSGAGGGGVILMPSQWTQGSYAELERRLGDLRDNGGRAFWWHVTRRYRYGTEQRLVVPLRSLSGGRDPTPILPANARLVADGERTGRKRANVIAYVWDARVDERVAGLGLEQLARTMYAGDRGRIVLPPSVLTAVAGRKP